MRRPYSDRPEGYCQAIDIYYVVMSCHVLMSKSLEVKQFIVRKPTNEEDFKDELFPSER